jgi:hypothetical protein
MRFEVAPGRQLSKGCVHLLERRRRTWPPGLAEDLVGPQLQAVLSLRGGKDVHDAAIESSLVGTDVPEQVGGVARNFHGARSSVT